MICQPCRGNEHAGCRGGTWCDCQHRTDRQPAVQTNHWSDYPPPHPPSSDDLPAALPTRRPDVLLGVASPSCTCTEQVDLDRGVFAVPPRMGCPAHGDDARWLRAVTHERERR